MVSGVYEAQKQDYLKSVVDASRINERKVTQEPVPEQKKPETDRVQFSQASVKAAESGLIKQAGATESVNQLDKENKPDFKAVNLIKKSEIPVKSIQEIVSERMERQSTKAVESSDGNAQTVEQIAAEKAQPEESDKKPETVLDKIESENVKPEETKKSAVAQLRERIEKMDSPENEPEKESKAPVEESGKLTAAQTKGVEAYQQIQNYQNPLNISIAGTAV